VVQPLRLNDPTTPMIHAQLDGMIRQIGERLTHVLFSSTTRAVVVKRINAVDQGRPRLSISVGQHGVPSDQALALPWELLMPEDGTFAVRDSHLDAIREAVTEGASPLEAPTSSLAVVVTLAWNPTVAPGHPEVARLHCQSTPPYDGLHYARAGGACILVAGVDPRMRSILPGV
jgi:hypothetical protein